MDLYYGSLQFYAHLEEMRMVCNTHSPPQLQGMEYPRSDRPETPPPGGGLPELRAVQEDRIFFFFFAMNYSLSRYVYYCSVQILY